MVVNYSKALDTALELEHKLDEALEELRKASNWGIADLFGGLLVVSAIKQSKMSKANKMLEEIETIGRRLSDELGAYASVDFGDLKLQFNNAINITDVIIDNTISDVAAQSRIEKAWKQVKEMYDLNERLIKKLKNM